MKRNQFRYNPTLFALLTISQRSEAGSVCNFASAIQVSHIKSPADKDVMVWAVAT